MTDKAWAWFAFISTTGIFLLVGYVTYFIYPDEQPDIFMAWLVLPFWGFSSALSTFLLVGEYK